MYNTYMLRISLRVFSSSNGVDQSDQNKIPNELKNNENIKKIYFYKYHLKSPKMIACSTILYRFNNLHLVGHNCLRISNTSDVPEFIKSWLIHHPPIYNWPFQTSSAFNITFIKITKHIYTNFPTLTTLTPNFWMLYSLLNPWREHRTRMADTLGPHKDL